MAMSAFIGTRPVPGGFPSPILLAWWQKLPRSLARCIASGLLATLAAASALAAPGELDPTFGDAGRARVTILDESGYPVYPQVQAIAQQADGKLLLGGTVYSPDTEGNYSNNLLLIRLNADGSLDTSFDSDGWTTVDVAPNEFGGSNDYVFALTVQPDGKIIAAGETIDSVSTYQPDMVLMRLNADGSLDTTFGTGGIKVYDSGGTGTDRARGIVYQATGSLVIAGNTDRNGEQDIIFARFTSSGVLDTTFGADGETIVSFGAFSTETVAGLAQDSNGALVAVGQGPGGSSQQTMIAIRLTADGDLDTSFDTDGLSVVNFGTDYAEGRSVDIRQDDKIVLAGSVSTAGGRLPAIALLDTDGSLDTTFSGDGTASPDLNPGSSNDEVFGVAVEPDNQVVIAGGFRPDDYELANDMFVARLDADGGTDATFGNGGVSIADFGVTPNLSYARATLLLRQADGRLVAAGQPDGGWQDIHVARFDSTGGGSGGVLSFQKFQSYWDENAGTITIPVRRTGGATGPVSVQVRVGWTSEYFTGFGAGEGCDYQDVTATLTWNSGDYADKQVSITLIDDAYQEFNDYFNIELYGASGATTAMDSHQVNINYDAGDATVPDLGTVSIEPEKNVGESDGQVTLVISRTGEAQDCAVVGVYTQQYGNNYLATPGIDYTSISGLVQFGDGDTANKQISIPITDDSDGERDEQFGVFIDGGYAPVDNYVAVVTILDNDGGFAGVIDIYGDYYDEESDGVLGGPLTLSRTEGSNGQVTVDYTVTSGTATAGQDFLATSGTVVWSDGDTSDKDIFVEILEDSLEEADETYIVTISNPTGGAELGYNTSATQVIADNDTPYPGEFIVTSYTYTFDEDIGTINAAVQRRNGVDGAVSVSYSTADGTALDGSDYTGVSGTVEFADGVGCDRNYNCTGPYLVNVPIAIIDDADYEPAAEDFAFNLSNPTGGAVLGTPATNTFTIRPNDSPNGSIEMILTSAYVNEAAGSITVQATRTGGSQGVVTVDYDFTPYYAVLGEDFDAVPGTLTWADGELGTKNIVVTILDDQIVDPNEFFSVQLSNVTGGAILEPLYYTTVYITDDESLPGTLSFYSPLAVNEGNATATLYVYRSYGSLGAVSANYTTAPGTAIAPDDFTATSGTVSWADGETTSKQIIVPIVDDALSESTESFTIEFSGATGGLSLPYTTATVEILDDDNPGVISMSLASVSISESAATLNITATRTVASVGAVSVSFATADGTAAAGSDYTAASGTLSWANLEAGSKTMSITVLDDAIEETDETFVVTLSNPTGSVQLGTATTTVTIEDNDANPGTLRFTVATRDVSEAAATVQIDVERFGGSLGEVTVAYATADGTALAGGDYTTTSGTLTWIDGARDTRSFSVPIVNDTAREGDETFVLTLSNPTGGAVLGTPSTETVTITNDDAANGLLGFSVSNASVTEGTDVDLTVTRTAGSYGAVDVNYYTSNSSATAPDDYAEATGTLSWSDGDTSSRLVTVTTVDDETDEPAELFYVVLSEPTGGADIGTGSVLVTLEDNDTGPPGTLRVLTATASVGEANTQMSVTVTRTGGASGPASVDFTTQDDTAAAGQDYVAASGTLNWGDFDSNSKSITIQLTDDTVDEPDETFFVLLSNATGATLDAAADTTTVTIVDNDLPPVPGILAVTGPASVSEAAGNITYTFSRTGGTDGEVGLSYTTTADTATAGEDFTAASGTLTWADGDGVSKTVAVTIIDDAVDEPNEAFSMDISDPTGGASLGNASRTTLILDNDVSGPGTLSIGGASVYETVGNAILSVYRSDGFDGAISVDYVTTQDTALEGQDFTAVSGTLNWADGDGGTKLISVPVINDQIEEPYESFTVNLSNPGGGATISQSVGTVSIQDDDVPGTLAFIQTATVVDETDGSMTVSVSRSIGNRGAVSVSYATTAGSATDGSDFTGTSGILSWADGDSANKSFTIPILDDTAVEFDENFTVALSTPTGGASLGNALLTVTIVSDEVPVPGTVRMVAPSLTVGEADGTVNVAVERVVGSDGAVSIDYTTQVGTATAADFTPTSGTLDWADGDTANKVIAVTIINDAAFEADEQFAVNLSNPQGGVILAEASTTVTIQSEDAPVPGVIGMASATASVNETAGTLTLSVTRTGGSDGTVGVSFATAAGSATDGADFTGATGTLSWASGDTTDKTITVPILDDSDFEPDETFTVTLSSVTGGASLGTDTTTVTIVNDDPAQQGRIEMASATASVNETAGTVTITVNRVSGSDGAVGVDYATAPGSATDGSDFTGTAGSLSWADGDSAAKTIAVDILDDTDFELSETFTVALSNVSGGAVLGTDTTTVTIVNDDAGIPGTLGLTETAVAVDETAGTVTLTVTRTGGADDTVSVNYATAPGTATAADFTATSGTLTWANADAVSQTITVPITDDTLYEADEAFTVTLSGITGGATLGTSLATITIASEDAPQPGVIGMAVATRTIDETAGTVVLSVTRTGGADLAVGVSYATAPGSATAADFTATSGSLDWTNGDSTAKTITVPIINDALYEPDEAFTVMLSDVTGGATLGTDTTTVTIASDDPPQPGTLGLTQSAVSVDETAGTVTLTVSRTGGTDGAVGVSYATATGTATSGDFTATSGVLNWADGDAASQTITVPITDDAAVEANEAFAVTLSNPTGDASLGTATATVTILDDDIFTVPGVISLTVSDVTVDETDGTITFTVTRSNGLGGAVEVSYETASGSATAGEDFEALSGLLTWLNGEGGSKTLTVTLIDDTLVEDDETFTLTLSNPSGGATLGTATVTVTVQSEDIPPDTEPDPFEFTEVGGVTPLAEVQSNEITVSGINAPAPISIDEGEYSIDGGPWTLKAGTVEDGARVRIRVIAAGTYETTVQATLTIGGVSSTFLVTTRPETSEIVVKAKGGGGAIGLLELMLLAGMALGLRLRPGPAAAAALLGCLVLAPAARADDSGLYVGAGVGQSEVGVSQEEARRRVEASTGDTVTSMSFDQKDTSFHVRVGYAFNPMFALEAAYYEFGDTRSEVVAEVLDPQAFVEAMADAFPSNVHGPALVARLSWPFAERWAVHLRGGVISWQSDIDAEIISGGSGQFKASRDGEDLIWGVALAWQPSERFAVSLEFTQAQISDDVRTLELGVTWMTGWLSR
jgi:uncharacterized delta-60 repeat protein